jgi:hypothetical protein
MLPFRRLEANLLHATLWNYTADNNNQWGDQWNEEDLSIFSLDQQHDPDNIHSGGRALQAVVRPYAVCTAGEPLSMKFDLKRRAFEFEFRHDVNVERTDRDLRAFIPISAWIYRSSDGWRL